MSYIGPLYIFSKHDKFLHLLATIDDEVIEQIFHVSHLKQGLLQLPNGKRLLKTSMTTKQKWSS